MKHIPIDEHGHEVGGVRKLYKFENGYGASVIKTPYSYGGRVGLWELAVLRFDGEDSQITYDTPITTDVEGRLSDAEVEALLDRIAALPAWVPA